MGHQRDQWQKPDEVIVKKRIMAEVTRYKKFEASLLGQDINFEVGDIDIKRYIKFLLKDGNIEEKREIISYFEGRVTLKQKRIELEVAR